MSALTELMARQGWSVPDGFEPMNVGHCKRCTHQILWTRTYGRFIPLDRDGTKHPMDCRVGFASVRTHDTGRSGPLRKCPYCTKSTMRYSEGDLGLHVHSQHPIARTLPRQGA